MTDTIETPLSESPGGAWVNTILYRLARALDYPKDDNGGYTIDPDAVLNDAVKYIEEFMNLGQISWDNDTEPHESTVSDHANGSSDA